MLKKLKQILQNSILYDKKMNLKKLPQTKSKKYASGNEITVVDIIILKV